MLPGGFCGSTIADASNCDIFCPGGLDSECPTGQLCFLDILSTECKNLDPPKNNFCGLSFSDAAICSSATMCPNGLNSECSIDQICYTVSGEACDFSSFPSNNNFCGLTFADASARCDQTCPNAVDTECPLNEQCFSGINPAVCGRCFKDAFLLLLRESSISHS